MVTELSGPTSVSKLTREQSQPTVRSVFTTGDDTTSVSLLPHVATTQPAGAADKGKSDSGEGSIHRRIFTNSR